MTEIRNEFRDIITNFTEIKRIIRRCCELLCTNKCDHRDEPIPRKHRSPTLTQEEIADFHKPIQSKIEPKPPNKGPDGFPGSVQGETRAGPQTGAEVRPRGPAVGTAPGYPRPQGMSPHRELAFQRSPPKSFLPPRPSLGTCPSEPPLPALPFPVLPEAPAWRPARSSLRICCGDLLRHFPGLCRGRGQASSQ